jgi:hypothetical protein
MHDSLKLIKRWPHSSGATGKQKGLAFNRTPALSNIQPYQGNVFISNAAILLVIIS